MLWDVLCALATSVSLPSSKRLQMALAVTGHTDAAEKSSVYTAATLWLL